MIRKQAIEGHFQSIEPRPLPQFNGVVPGTALIAKHNAAQAKVHARVRAGIDAKPQNTNEDTALSGVLLRPSLAAGAIPTSIVTGDFNGDGKEDFILANGLTNDLWFYLGNGDGTFQLPQIIPLSKGLTPVGLATASLRKNGILDLVVAESDSSTIGVLLGNGDGTFGYETVYELPEPPESVVIDDFNHDGNLSIAVVMDTLITPQSNQIPWIASLAGDGSGHFAAPVITYNSLYYGSAWNITSADVNKDGFPDVLITGPGFENSTIYLNNHDGSFTAGQTVIENGDFNSVLDGRLGDINGDGCPDAVVADAWTMVWVAYGDCAGNFTAPKPIYLGASNAAIRLADVNGDGNLDIITSAFAAFSQSNVGMYGGNSINVALGDGKGNFGPARNYTGWGQSYSISTADFTGSGKLDVVASESDSETATVYRNDGTGNFGFPQGIYAGVLGTGAGTINAPFSDLSFADINNDGQIDAFLVDEGMSGELYATSFLNDGTGRFTGPINSDTGAQMPTNWIGDYRLGSFRTAGKIDMVAIGLDQAYSFSVQFILFLAGNGDGTFAKGTPIATTGADGIMTTGDFNKDGKLDFVAVNGFDSHTLTCFLGNGDGTFRALAPLTFTDSGNGIGGSDVARIYTGDFNRDGRLDVLVFTTGNGYWTTESSVWEFDGNGDGTFQTPRQLYTDFQPFALADLNGDGYPDIARYNFMWPDGTTETLGPATYVNYLGQSNGSFVEGSTYSPYVGIPESVQPETQNGDPLASSMVGVYSGSGKADEVAFQFPADGAALSNAYAQILMGNGNGTFTPSYDVFPFFGGYPLYAAHLSGSSISDMVEVDNATSSLHVFQGGAAPVLQIALAQAIVTNNQGCGWVFPDLASSSSQSVALSSSVSGVMLPASVTLPAGALSAKFCYTLASNFNWHQVFDINATLNNSTATAYASASYVLGFSETLSAVTPTAVYQGQSPQPITVTLTAQPGYSSTANLSCEGLSQGDSCLFSSTTLNVSPGHPASTTVTLVTAANAAAYGNVHSFTIVADDGNVIQRQTASLDVATLFIFPPSYNIIPALSPGTGTTQFNLGGIPPYQFSCSGLPTGTTCSFSGTQQPFPSDSSINLAVNVSANIADADYPLQMTVTSQSNDASVQYTLRILSYSIQGPPAANSWVFPGTAQNIPVSILGSSNWTAGWAVTINCTLDTGTSCAAVSVVPGSGLATTVNLSLNVPAGTSLGQHQLTVTGSFNGSVQTYTFPIYIVSLSGSLSASALTMARGGTGTLTVTLNASTGFNGDVSLGCAGTTQLSCTSSPAYVQLTGGTAQTATITVTATTTADLKSRPTISAARILIALAGLLPLALISRLQRKRLLSHLMLCLFALITLTFVGACSGGGSTGGGGGGGGSDVYTLTLNAYPSGTAISSNLGTVSVTVTH